MKETRKEKFRFFQAVCRSIDGTYFLSPTLYCDSARAREELGPHYVKLATELPPIEIEVEVGKHKITRGE